MTPPRTDRDRPAGEPVETASAAPTRPADPTAGPAATTVGPYEVVRELGRGGMGVVYEWREPALKRHVAVNAMRPGVVPPA